MYNKEYEMTTNILDIAKTIKKRLWIIVLIAVIAGAASWAYSEYFTKPMYESRISVVIGKMPDKVQQNTLNYSDIMMFQSLVKTYAQIATSRTVAQNTIDSLKLSGVISVEKMQEQIIVTPQTDTQIMNIDVKDENPEMAKNKVHAAALAFIKEAQRIFPDGNVQTIDEASVPNKPISPDKVFNVVIAFLLGLMGAVGLIFLLEYLDNTIQNEITLEKYTGIPVIGVIPKVKSV